MGETPRSVMFNGQVEETRPLTVGEVRRLLTEHLRQAQEAGVARQIRAWQWAFAVVVGLVVLAVCIIGVLAIRPSVQPYPIVYDPDGALLWHGDGAPIAVEERFIGVAVQQWVDWARWVTADQVVLRKWRESATAMVDGQAASTFKAYLEDSLKVATAPQGQVRVDVTHRSLVRESSSMYRLTWEERWTPAYGHLSETHQMQGWFVVEFRQQPAGLTKELLRKNPRRLYVTDYAWSPVVRESSPSPGLPSGR